MSVSITSKLNAGSTILSQTIRLRFEHAESSCRRAWVDYMYSRTELGEVLFMSMTSQEDVAVYFSLDVA